ncbi:MAG: PSD1 and planctomycete cytochrome C domain-containing protein [Gemmataceae bacterium]
MPSLRRLALCALALVYLADSLRASDTAALEHFEKKVRPVLVQHCYRCHSVAARKARGGLVLDSRDGIRKGGDSGPAVVPGNLTRSLLVAAVRHESFKMPPDKPLPPAVVEDLVAWVRQGAIDPRDKPSIAKVSPSTTPETPDWWSLRPVVRPTPPAVRDTAWPAGPIDRFILARLEAANLRPAPPAEPRVLARRLSFALTGLPPRPDLLDSFLADRSPHAYDHLVDQLLASPHFGEHWARHWMDVVRYTDTYGYEWDIAARGAWRYRDYLVRAFNGDLPFDQLVREQIAGDLLEHPRLDPIAQINESRLGTMFFQLGEKRHGDSAEFNGIHQEMLDNKIDAFSKAFQATTLSCARCHDHKLDPIAQREYYALAGIFQSARWLTSTVDLPQRDQPLREQLVYLKSQLRPRLTRLWLDSARGWNADTFTQANLKRGKKQTTLEDELHPVLALLTTPPEKIASAWTALANRYRDEHQKRRASNAGHFSLLADFRQGIPPGWSVDGVGLRDIVPCGDFTVQLNGDRLIGQILHGGLCTSSLSPRLNGAVRTPFTHTLPAGNLSFEIAGGDFSAVRTVVDNAFLTERQRYLNQQPRGWQMVDPLTGLKDRNIYIEIATKTSNPNFPPRVGLGGACSETQAADPRSWFALSRVYRHMAPFSPADDLARFQPLFQGPAPTTLPEVLARYRAWATTAIEAFSQQRATDDHVQLLNTLLAADLLPNRLDPRQAPDVADLVTRYRNVEARLAEPWTVNGLADLDPPHEYRLNVRGDYDQLGAAIPRGYVRAIAPTAERISGPGSGRRQLADLVASPANPLTARVFVNRVWHWLFDAGLVATVDDFGHAGEAPSHPELLDYLASRFVEEGWSLKRLVRALVLTSAWRQGQAVDPRALAVEPRNRLVHHMPLRRLEAEALRDAMLTASGRLDPQLGGPTLNPYRVKEDPEKRLFSGPLDGLGRRSLYTRITIMEPPRFLATFNQPTPKIPTGRRDVTTTPAQSLTLLNDPFVQDQATHWARGLIARADDTPAARLTHMFRLALGRAPTSAELTRWGSAIEGLAAEHQVAAPALLRSEAVWRDVAHTLFNTKEFLHVR